MNLIQLRNIFLLLFVGCFFLFPRLQTGFIALSFLFVLFDKAYYAQFRSMFNVKVGVFMMLYYLALILSLLYTSNTTEGLRSLETKFSLLAFPLFLPYIFSGSQKLKFKIFNGLLISGVGYIVASYITAAIGYASTGRTSEFFYGELGVGFFQEHSFLHPTYASFFYNILFAYLGLKLINGRFIRKKNGGILALMVLITLFIFMLSSKFGILALCLNLFMLIFYFAKKRKRIGLAILIWISFLGIGYITIVNSPLKNRFEAAYEELTQPDSKKGSTQIRKDVWQVTIELIKENPILGVGAGDVRDELAKKYKERGYEKYAEMRYDSHQQFLQTFASLGIVGLIILVIIFVLLFTKSFQERNYLLLIFTTLFFMFGLVESMLERQAGVTFFTFFGLFLYLFNPFANNNKP